MLICMRVCVRACVRACMRACMRACVCVMIMLGVFDDAKCSFKNMWHISISDLILYCRIFIDSIGGLELDIHGSRKRRWTWKEQIEHVHAPPIQPIMFALTRHLAVRIISQEHITLTFSYGINACRFQVGSKLKVTVELSYCQSFNFVGIYWPPLYYIYCCSTKISNSMGPSEWMNIYFWNRDWPQISRFLYYKVYNIIDSRM